MIWIIFNLKIFKSILNELSLILSDDRMAKEIIDTIYRKLEHQRKAINEILASKSNQQLNWHPQKDRNSIGNLIEHLTGSEGFWIVQGITRTDIGRQRSLEFFVKERNKITLEKEYLQMSATTTDILNNLTDNDLLDKKTINKKIWTVLEILLHVIEHNNYHIGQMWYINGLLKGDEFLAIPK